MNFDSLLSLVKDEPVFDSSLLMSGRGSPAAVHLQLSRWIRAGRLVQVRRGLYALAATYARTAPHPFLLANRIRQPSYVSLQPALAWYGMIPEYVPVVTSVTTGHARDCRNAMGDFLYRHVKRDAFRGYRRLEVQPGQAAFVATPEKGLLDLIHLTVGADAESYLRELRLQNLEALSIEALRRAAREWGSPKLLRAVEGIARLKEEAA